jgi:amidase
MIGILAVLLTVSAALQPSPPARFHLVEATIDDVRSALASKQITCRTLIDQYIKRIEAYDKSGPSLNAVQTVNRRALQDAERLDTASSSRPKSRPATILHSTRTLLQKR